MLQSQLSTELQSAAGAGQALTASAGAPLAEGVGRESALGETHERSLSLVQARVAVRARSGLIENQRLPTDHVRELLRCPLRLCTGLPGFVLLQLLLDLIVPLPAALARAARRSSSPTPLVALVALVNSIANSVSSINRLVEDIVHQITDVVRDRFDDAEDLLEHIADQVGRGDPEILGKPSNVVRQLLGDPSVQHALFASVSLLAATGPPRMARLPPGFAFGLRAPALVPMRPGLPRLLVRPGFFSIPPVISPPISRLLTHEISPSRIQGRCITLDHIVIQRITMSILRFKETQAHCRSGSYAWEMANFEARFGIGQVIHHRRFEYRGVIADVDATFQGTDEWYEQVALSRPPRDQPWYHVLVDESRSVTYVAERHLEVDEAGGAIRHPLLESIFDRFRVGRYLRSEPLN